MESIVKAVSGREDQGGSLSEREDFAKVPFLERFLPGDLRGRFLVVLFGVLLPSLTLFGVLHHDSVKRSLLNEVDQTLNNRAAEVQQVLKASGITDQSGFADFEMVNSALMVTSAPEVYVNILSQQGDLLWASKNVSGDSIPANLAPFPSVLAVDSITHPDGLRLRRLTTPLVLEDGTKVLLVLAESLTHLEAALKGSIGRTVLLGLVCLALTEIAANLAFRGIFYPLRKLVNTAETIVSTDDVTRRVPVYHDADTEIRRTAVAFNQLMERVEQLLEMAKRLLADTSHELRNPLTVIMTDLDLLREDLTPEQRDEVVTEAQRTVRRLNRLVADLLLLSRTEAHSEVLETDQIEVLSFVEKVAERFARSVQAGQAIRVVSELDSPERCALLNRERTEQILTNLFENGVRYSNGQDLTVKILEDLQDIIISVRDTGCGIAVDEQDKVFDRFYRVDAARARHSGGTGLGLSVARALARLQGGDIDLTSKLGEGSDFRVRFPKLQTNG